MKSAFTTVLIGAFLAIAAFGVFAMNHAAHAHGGCLASIASGAPCPEEDNPLASAVFHLNAFKGFSTATLGSSMVGIFLLLAFVCAFLRLSGRAHFSLERVSFCGSADEQSPPVGERIRCWLALHENSPAVSWTPA